MSIRAISGNSIKVTFSAPVDTTKATFTVTNSSGAIVNFQAPTWDSTNTQATLVATASQLASDTYTVTVGGLGLPSGQNSGTVKITPSTVTTIAINNTNLPGTLVPLNVAVTDQYGQAVTINPTQYTVTAYDTTAGTSLNVVPNAKNNGWNLDLTKAANGQNFAPGVTVKSGDSVVITIIHNATGVKGTATLNVAAAPVLTSFSLGTVSSLSGKTLIMNSDTGIKVPYTAKDQYGNSYTLKAGDLQFISSNAAVLPSGNVSIDGSGNIVISGFNAGSSGSVTLTAVNPVNGQTSQTTFTVNAQPAPDAATVAKSSVTIAAGNTNVVNDALTVTDQYGNTVAVGNYTPSQFTVTASNSAVVAKAGIALADDEDSAGTPLSGTKQGQLYIQLAPGATAGQTATVTIVNNQSGKSAQVQVTVGQTATASHITLDKNSSASNNLLVGGSVTLTFDVTDQYGNAVGAGSTVYFAVANNATNVTLDKTTANTDANGQVTVTVTGAASGSATVTASLMNGPNTVDSTSVNFTVGANQSSGLTYTVAAIPKLYGDGWDTDMPTTVADGYAQPIVVNATDASGTTYQVPTSSIVNVTSDDPNLHFGVVNGKEYVADGSETNLNADKTATLYITVNASDGVKTLTQQVTISKDSLQPVSVAFMNETPSIANAATAKPVTSITLSNKAAYAGNIAGGVTGGVYEWVKDQFGGYRLSNSPNTLNAGLKLVPLSGMSNASDDQVALNAAAQDGTLTVTDTKGDTAFTANNAQFRVVATDGAYSAYINVTVTDGVPPVAAATNPITVSQANPGTYAANDTITLTFSEPVSTTSLVIGGVSVNHSHKLGAGATITPVNPSGGYATSFKITLGTSPSIASGDTITVTAEDVVDQAGNTAAANITFTAP